MTVGTADVQAEIATDQAFDSATWEMIQEQTVQGASGVVQSICCTDDYIICIENISDSPADFDVVYFYYKNNVDEAGNPVEQYSLAKTVSNMSYEHSNGMAYNPNTNEIAISLYTNNEGDENRGAVYIVDATTFDFKSKVKISADYNILGIDYKKDTDQYVIQTNTEGNYSFKILDSNFQIVDDLGEYADTAEGDNFQDLCVDGDYIINFPLTLGLGIGDFIHMYSISRRAMVSAPQVNWGFVGVTGDEPEGLCEVAPGEFVAVVNVTLEDGTRNFRLYKTIIPYNFAVTTSVKNGTVTESQTTLARGDSFTAKFEPKENYTIDSIVVDGEKIDAQKYYESYTISDIHENHTIEVNYKELNLLQKAGASVLHLHTGEPEKKAAEKPAEKSGFRIPRGVVIGLILFVLLLGAFALYLRILYVRRLRILKRRRAARERRRIKEAYERMEPDELEDLEMRDYIEIK